MRPFGLKITVPKSARRVLPWTAALLLAGTASGFATPAAAAEPGEFVPFDEFIDQVAQSEYPAMSAQGTTGKIAGHAAFDEMRDYVLDMYTGVEVTHSFVYDESQFDCVVTETQPSMRKLGITEPATPPEPATMNGSVSPDDAATGSILGQGYIDPYGNAVSCDEGTIPMLRISWDRLSQFTDLDGFLAKAPDSRTGLAPDPQEPPQPKEGPHKYAHARQDVSNHGGQSTINVWDPNAWFSLSQQWYTAGSGDGLQTVEGGWVKYDGFGDQSVLFIYHTPDNYQSGCYNLDCAAFVQTSDAYPLGGPFDKYSVPGGDQRVYVEQWQLNDGDWWLFLGPDEDSVEPIGYFPASVYNDGPVTKGADDIDYGGEVTADGPNYGEMGSGKFASEGWQHAAFQNRIFYLASGGGTSWASLNPDEPSPNCYSIDYTPFDGSDWATYFYYGGPGGGNC